MTAASFLQFPYTCAVVSEALRLYPPGANTLRETGDDLFQLGPYALPPRTTLVVGTYVMQRDPHIWPKAASFLPERWLPVRTGGALGGMGRGWRKGMDCWPLLVVFLCAATPEHALTFLLCWLCFNTCVVCCCPFSHFAHRDTRSWPPATLLPTFPLAQVSSQHTVV